MPAERSGPAVSDSSGNMGGKGVMIKAPDDLQDLRRKIYAKAKAEAHWRFWGLYVHVCKRETLRAAYAMAKSNDGAPGSDGVTFEVIEEQGVESFRLSLSRIASRTRRRLLRLITTSSPQGVRSIGARCYLQRIR